MATATKSRKYRFATRQAAEDAERKSGENAHVSEYCLTAVIAGDVHWLKRGRYSAGIINPESATGGYLVIRYDQRGEKPWASAHYLDHWVNDTIRYYELIAARDQDQLDIRQLAYDVRCYRNTAAGY